MFAVPGPWTSERSQGCHRLIAEGAGLVEDPATLLRTLGLAAARSGADALAFAGSADQQALLRALAPGPRPADLLQRECRLERGPFLRAVFELEQRGALRRLPGDLLLAQARAAP